jgi:hypothetical protein
MELLKLSPVDPWRLEQAVSGVIILGATRSGKTSGPFQHIIRSFLRSKFGGIFFCVKPEAAGEGFVAKFPFEPTLAAGTLRFRNSVRRLCRTTAQ